MTAVRTTTALLRAARPKQWSKNLLVCAAPLAAGVLTDEIGPVLCAFAVFTLAASGVYLVNDVRDAPSDRLHERKRRRPVAAGELSERLALGVGVGALVLSVVLATLLEPVLGLTVFVYVLLQVAYAWGLKDQPVLDLAVVASGFLLRAIAGGVVTDVEPSQWFLLVTSFGALFVVAGKRYSELRTIGAAGGTRHSLTLYSESYLRFVWSFAAAVTVTTYCLWAFDIGARGSFNWQAASIVPFVLALLRYAVDIDLGLAGEPEDAVLRDPVLLVLSGVWVATFAAGVYVL